MGDLEHLCVGMEVCGPLRCRGEGVMCGVERSFACTRLDGPQVVIGDNGGELGIPCCGEPLCDREMPLGAFSLREAPIGDLTNRGLDELVLTPLRRAGIVLEPEDLSGDEVRECIARFGVLGRLDEPCAARTAASWMTRRRWEGNRSRRAAMIAWRESGVERSAIGATCVSCPSTRASAPSVTSVRRNSTA